MVDFLLFLPPLLKKKNFLSKNTKQSFWHFSLITLISIIMGRGGVYIFPKIHKRGLIIKGGVYITFRIFFFLHVHFLGKNLKSPGGSFKYLQYIIWSLFELCLIMGFMPSFCANSAVYIVWPIKQWLLLLYNCI